jgi:hypothetical protein
VAGWHKASAERGARAASGRPGRGPARLAGLGSQVGGGVRAANKGVSYRGTATTSHAATPRHATPRHATPRHTGTPSRRPQPATSTEMAGHKNATKPGTIILIIKSKQQGAARTHAGRRQRAAAPGQPSQLRTCWLWRSFLAPAPPAPALIKQAKIKERAKVTFLAGGGNWCNSQERGACSHELPAVRAGCFS